VAGGWRDSLVENPIVMLRRVIAAVALCFANPLGVSAAALQQAPENSLTAVHYPAAQVSGCTLVGKAFGTLAAGGDIIVQGQRFQVTASHATAYRIVYSRRKVVAVFPPVRRRRILAGDDRAPDRAGPDLPATLHIEIADFVITSGAREHCVVFE